MQQLLSNNLLSFVIFLPLVGAILLMLFPHVPDEAAGTAHGTSGEAPAQGRGGGIAVRWFALLVSLADFGASLGLMRGFHPGHGDFQYVEGPFPWIQQYGVHYHVGLDGIGLLFVLLTTFTTVLAVLYSFVVKTRIKEFMVFLLILEAALNGVFSALDLVLFYVFWEAVLIPMYFLIGVWGHDNRVYAAVKFFIYTFVGSILMLVAIVYLYAHTGTFSLLELTTPGTSAHTQLAAMSPRTLMWLYAAFALAFMIKVPMFPFHTWLPDAHVEAPTAGSVILAGVLLKMGVYGFLRFCIPLFPAQALQSAPLFLTLAVVGIIYGAVVAAVQPDMKKVVAYSSVSHLGFVMLGVFSFTTLGLTGAMLQSLNHGVSTGMLFFLVGMLYDRRHTREIAAFGGIKRSVPVLSAFFLLAMLSSIALPLTNGFVGEFTILQGSYLRHGFAYTAWAATGMVLSAVYMLWLFQRVFTGPLLVEENRSMPDLGIRERAVLAPLVVMIFWFGMYVTSWTGYLDRPVGALLGYVGANSSIARSAVRMPVAMGSLKGWNR
ncbi:MAG: complex I subunit 4 family protein [Chthonomonadales bacterium]